MGETKVIRKMLSIIENQEWKDLRAAVSPTFTSGKIKRVKPFSLSCLTLVTRMATSILSYSSTQPR